MDPYSLFPDEYDDDPGGGGGGGISSSNVGGLGDDYDLMNSDVQSTFMAEEGAAGCSNLTSIILENCTLKNMTEDGADVPRDFAVRVIIGVVLTLIILATIVGKLIQFL